MKREEGRCSTHGLAVGPDGRCALCRRAGAAGAGRADKGRLTWVIAIAVLVGGAITALLIHRHYKAAHRIAVSPRSSPPVASKAALPRPAVVARPPKPAVERDWRKEPDRRRQPANLYPHRHSRVSRRAPTRRFSLPGGASRGQWLAAMRRVPITLYCTETSAFCKGARVWLERNRLKVIERDIDKDASARAELRQLNPRLTVPTLQIDGKAMTDFNAGVVWQALVAVARRRLGQ